MPSLSTFLLIAIALDAIILEVVIILEHRKQKRLTADNEQLRNRIAEREQVEGDLKRQTAELSAAKEQLQDEISRHERGPRELQGSRDELEQRLQEQADELATAKEQLQREIAERQQAEEYLVLLRGRLDGFLVDDVLQPQAAGPAS